MSVYRPKGSPFYHFDFQFRGDRFHGSTRQTERRTAEAVERTERERVKAAASAGTPAGAITLDHAAGRYWQEVGQHQAGAENTKVDLAYLIEHLGKDRPLDTITGDDVAKLVAWRRGHRIAATGKLVAPGTVDRTTKMLRRLFTHAREAWHMRFDREPVWRKHLIDKPHEHERVRELQDDEAARLDEVLRDDYRPLFDYAQATGQRKAECYGLRWSEVNWGTRQIVRRGKGGRPNMVPITDEVRAILWPLRGHHPEFVFTYVVQRTQKIKGEQLVKGERHPITKGSLNSRWRRMRKAAGVNDFRFHDFRHTFATGLLRDCNNLRIVQQALCHRDIKTTVRYAHVLDDDLARALDRHQKSRNKSRTALRKIG
jgi:integrase